MEIKKELIEKIKESEGLKLIVAKQKKRGGYTVYPQVVDVVEASVPMVGDCLVVVYED